MKKSSWFIAIVSLVVVLALSYLGSTYLIPLFNRRIYSETSCLTDSITQDMDIYDIAKLYRNNSSTVEVIVTSVNSETGNTEGSLGSGVVVASNGYQTSLEGNYVASQGSYIATNYHVISNFDNSAYSSNSMKVRVDKKDGSGDLVEGEYDASLLWFNKDLDVAIIYTEENFNYVKMADRWLFCSKEDRLDYEQVFTIGTPLDESYFNRLTIGNIASDNNMFMFTEKVIYPYTSLGTTKFYQSPKGSATTEYYVLDNVYEDVIDIALGISHGNSGGGCFDANGLLIGLTTLGTSAELTDGNQMNGLVPIWPIMQVLDKVIYNNEKGSTYTIYDLETTGIVGVDALEASLVKQKQAKSGFSYFLDDKFYSTSSYSYAFGFGSEGYYIINGGSKLGNNIIVTKCTLKDSSGQTKQEQQIVDRNDFLYMLLMAESGDNLTVTYKTSADSMFSSTKTITF